MLGNLADNSTNGDSSSRTQNFVFDFTRMQSPTTIFEFRYGLLRQRANTNPKSLGFDQTSLGLPDVYLTSGVKMFPTFSPEGYQELGQVGYGLIARGDEMNDVTGSMNEDHRRPQFESRRGGAISVVELSAARLPAGSYDLTDARSR